MIAELLVTVWTLQEDDIEKLITNIKNAIEEQKV